MENNNLNKIKNSGFTAPKDYFKNFEDTILSNAKLKDSVSDSGFEVPDGYFENLEDSIMQKVSERDTAKVIPMFTKRNLIYISGVAAAVLLFFNVFYFESEVTFNSLDIETVENYIIDEGINSYEIASLLTEEDLLDSNFVENNYSDETIETYILDNLDIEDLIIE